MEALKNGYSAEELRAITVAIVPGRMAVEVSNDAGGVNVGGLSGDVSLETQAASSSVGSISSDFAGATRRESIVGMTAQGRLGNGSARITLRTTTGAIAIRER
ncbi:MAG: hypothetical protein JO324_00770 [Candidatus Eremiobacteraeota bacterium]|nr:hypothetical protein [Candidatus Eremiobacteraeota bacterium]